MKAVWHERRMRGLLQRFQDDLLSAREVAQVTSHLERCAACRHAVQQYTDQERILMEARPVRQELSGQAAQALLSRALTQAAASRYGTQRKRVAKMVGALAAATVLAGCWLLVLHFHAAKARVNPSDMAAHSVLGAIAPHQDNPVQRRPASNALAMSPSDTSPLDKTTPVIRHVPYLRNIAKSRITHALPHQRPAADSTQHGRREVERQHKRMAGPRTLPTPKAPVQVVRMEDVPEFPVMPPGGHLLVTVTDDIQTSREDMSPHNNLSLLVTQDTAETPGSATVAAHDVDAMGTLVWTQCTLQRHDTGEVTTRIATTWQTPEKQLAGLIVSTVTPTRPLSPSSAPVTQSKPAEAQSAMSH